MFKYFLKNFNIKNDVDNKLYLYVNILFCVLLIFYISNYTANAVLFYLNCPNTYMWGEVLISYVGGFIRRGLQGTFWMYLMSHGFDIKIIITVVNYILTLFLLIYCIHFVFVKFDSDIAYYLALSPGIFVFRLTDFGKFAKIDNLFIFVIMFLMYSFSTSDLKSKINYFLWYIVIFVAILTHEMLIFYLPLPFFILYIRFKKLNINRRYLIYYCSFIIIPTIYLILSYPGTIDQRITLETQILSYFPNYEVGRFNGVWWIGKGIKDNIPILFYTNNVDNLHINFVDSINQYAVYIWMFCVPVAYCLTLLPIVIFLKRYNFVRNIADSFTSSIELIIFIACLLTPCLLIMLTMDSGRFISMHAVEILFFIVYFANINNIKIKSCCTIDFYTARLLFIYSLGWQMHHWDPNYGMIVTPLFS